MKTNLLIVSLVLSGLGLFIEGKGQDTLRLYLNAGYVTSIIRPDDCTRPDAGFSARIGILTNKRIGFYAGYTGFQEYHNESIEYDDKGSLYIAGIDYRLLRRGEFRWYVKLGAAVEQFISTYPTRTETETSFKPDLGFLFNFKYFNLYAGWQPSAPSHFNIGLGFTLRFVKRSP
jgi:hypothetical protein